MEGGLRRVVLDVLFSQLVQRMLSHRSGPAGYSEAQIWIAWSGAGLTPCVRSRCRDLGHWSGGIYTLGYQARKADSKTQIIFGTTSHEEVSIGPVRAVVVPDASIVEDLVSATQAAKYTKTNMEDTS